jgi:hypothetical protein
VKRYRLQNLYGDFFSAHLKPKNAEIPAGIERQRMSQLRQAVCADFNKSQ